METQIVCTDRLLREVKWAAAYATSMLHDCSKEWQLKKNHNYDH